MPVDVMPAAHYFADITDAASMPEKQSKDMLVSTFLSLFDAATQNRYHLAYEEQQSGLQTDSEPSGRGQMSYVCLSDMYGISFLEKR